jgi:hypothetical protein
MAESVNLSSIAEDLLEQFATGLTAADRRHALLVDALRLVWNARGAADIAKLESTLASLMGGSASGPYVKNLDRALRALDE